jgi:hypothetical protein
MLINVLFWSWTAAADPTSFLALKSPGDRYAWIGAKIGREYLIKFCVAILLTPVVYAVHDAIIRWLRITPEPHEKRE